MFGEGLNVRQTRREGETARSSGQMSMIRAKAQSRLLQGKSEKVVETRAQTIGTCAKRRCTAVLITTFPLSCAGSPPILGCITCIICAVEFRFIGCLTRFGSIPNSHGSAASLSGKACAACGCPCGTNPHTISYRFANCGPAVAVRCARRRPGLVSGTRPTSGEPHRLQSPEHAFQRSQRICLAITVIGP